MSEDRAFLRAAIEHASEAVYFVDRERRITYWNAAAAALTGFSAAEVVGHRCLEGLLRHVDAEGHQLCHSLCPLQATMTDGRTRECRVFFHHVDGHRHPVWVTAAPVRNDAGEIIGAVELFRDARPGRLATTTVDRDRLDELERQTLSDPLTGVGNRRFAELHLRARHEELLRLGRGFGVLFVDIDHFKDFNDRHGHATGDEVLRAVARTLAASVRDGDVVGRWGGEEFLVVMGAVSAQTVAAAAERLRSLVDASSLRRPGGQELRITVSIGATCARAGESLTDLLERADRFLYQSKASGRDRVTADPSPGRRREGALLPWPQPRSAAG